MSIRARLLYLVLAVWLPAAIGFAMLAYLTYEREKSAAQAHIEDLALGLNAMVERELDSRVVMAKAFAGSHAVRDEDFRRFHEEASVAVAGTNSWAFLLTRSTLLVTTMIPWDGMRPVERSEGTEFATEGPSVGFRPRGLLSPKPVIGVFLPEAQLKPPRYNVGISFETSDLQKAVNGLNLPKGSVASIVDGKQLVIARSRDPEQWVGKPATGAISQRMQTSQFGFERSVTLDGIPSLAYLTPQNKYGWVVVIALPTAALAQTADRLTLQAIFASGILLVLGLAIALYVARSIAKPMVLLRNAAHNLARETVPPRLMTGVQEADEVSAALNEAGLRAKEAAETMERRVREAVSDARDAQARLLDARKHEAIGRLRGGIAHDFNNLLQTISTGHQLLDRMLDGAPAQRILHSARRATAKASELVKSMLTFGRAQGLAPVAVDVVDLLLLSQELTRKGLGERVELREKIEGELPPVLVDPTQLELALLNLVFNARDAMPEGGTVIVTGRMARTGEASEIGPDSFVCLEVRDTGHGMDEETRTKAFDPYFTTKPVGAGSGLGLAQVHALARQSGGDVRLESTPGRGTRVRLFLPVHASGSKELRVDAAQQSASEPSAKLNILMVEDDTLVSTVVVSALEFEGHQVTLCHSADEAITQLEGAQEFDVLFTDVVMPGRMTGLDLVSWCRVHRPKLPTVVATGYTTQQNSHGALILHKPYKIEDLVASLCDAARG